MKRNLWLIASLVLNCVLAAGWAWTLRPPAAPSRTITHVTTGDVAPDRRHVADQEHERTDVPGAAEWPRWLPHLRTAGVSPRVIASLVQADFDQRREKRMRELQRRYETGEIDAATLGEAHSQHDSEQEKELRLALGDEEFRRWDRENTLSDFAQAHVELTDTEREAAYALRKQRTSQCNQLEQANRRGEIDDADLNERLAAAETEYHDRLKPLLGDVRYQALHSTDDGLDAEMLRRGRPLGIDLDQSNKLADMQRAADQLQTELLQQYEAGSAEMTNYEARRQAIDAARDSYYQRILGADGFAEYRKNNDPRYQLMQRYAPAWNLSGADIDRVYGAIARYEQTVRDHRKQALPLDVATLTQQTEQALLDALGEERFAKLKRNDALRLDP